MKLAIIRIYITVYISIIFDITVLVILASSLFLESGRFDFLVDGRPAGVNIARTTSVSTAGRRS